MAFRTIPTPNALKSPERVLATPSMPFFHTSLSQMRGPLVKPFTRMQSRRNRISLVFYTQSSQERNLTTITVIDYFLLPGTKSWY